MWIFASLAVAAFIITAGSFLFGHDHDLGHDLGHDFGHDVSHDLDHGTGEPTISMFSTKVLGTLCMGFGAAGAIARYYEANYVVSSLVGVGAGAALSGIMYGALALIYGQQSTSVVQTSSAVGTRGSVVVPIEEGRIGEVGITVGGQYMTYQAQSKDGKRIPKGRSVRVIEVSGGHLVVEEVVPSVPEGKA